MEPLFAYVAIAGSAVIGIAGGQKGYLGFSQVSR